MQATHKTSTDSWRHDAPRSDLAPREYALSTCDVATRGALNELETNRRRLERYARWWCCWRCCCGCGSRNSGNGRASRSLERTAVMAEHKVAAVARLAAALWRSRQALAADVAEEEALEVLKAAHRTLLVAVFSASGAAHVASHTTHMHASVSKRVHRSAERRIHPQRSGSGSVVPDRSVQAVLAGAGQTQAETTDQAAARRAQDRK